MLLGDRMHKRRNKRMGSSGRPSLGIHRPRTPGILSPCLQMNTIPLSRGHGPGISDRFLHTAERALKREVFLLKGVNLPDMSCPDLILTTSWQKSVKATWRPDLSLVSGAYPAVRSLSSSFYPWQLVTRSATSRYASVDWWFCTDIMVVGFWVSRSDVSF